MVKYAATYNAFPRTQIDCSEWMSPEQCKILVQEQPTLAAAGTQIILWTFQSNSLRSTSIVVHIVDLTHF